MSDMKISLGDTVTIKSDVRGHEMTVGAITMGGVVVCYWAKYADNGSFTSVESAEIHLDALVKS